MKETKRVKTVKLQLFKSETFPQKITLFLLCLSYVNFFVALQKSPETYSGTALLFASLVLYFLAWRETK